MHDLQKVSRTRLLYGRLSSRAQACTSVSQHDAFGVAHTQKVAVALLRHEHARVHRQRYARAVHTCCTERKSHSVELGPLLHGLHTGVIASNGVNGDKASQQGLPAYGIVVCSCLLSAALMHMRFH